MHKPELTQALRALQGELSKDAFRVRDSAPALEAMVNRMLRAADLIGVLARSLEGHPVEAAFGVPKDWGAETDIGKALAKGQ